ncbi:MAG: hypothetical protein ACI8ZO_000858 [Flavobacteriales bacterium]|jgi:hypothetical protein
MRTFKYFAALVALLGFGSCDIERTYYFVERITLHEIPNFSQDANESGNDILPEIFIEITDIDKHIVWSSQYFSNVDSSKFPIDFELDNIMELNNSDFFLDVYDFDNLNQGVHDHLGGIVFPGRGNSSTYYTQYENTTLSGTISITVDMLVERE